MSVEPGEPAKTEKALAVGVSVNPVVAAVALTTTPKEVIAA
jgi:hypothetical protein